MEILDGDSDAEFADPAPRWRPRPRTQDPGASTRNLDLTSDVRTPAAESYTWIGVRGNAPPILPPAGAPPVASADVSDPLGSGPLEADLDSAATPAPRPGSPSDGSAQSPGHAETVSPSPRDVLLSADTLGLTGLLVAVASTISSLGTIAIYSAAGEAGQRTQLQHYYTFVAAAGIVAVLLGAAGLTRLRPSSSVFCRSSCGAAVLLGALLLIVAGVGIVYADGLPAAGAGVQGSN